MPEPALMIASQLAAALTVAMVLYELVTDSTLNSKDIAFIHAFCEVVCPLMNKLHAAALAGNVMASAEGVVRAAGLVQEALMTMYTYAKRFDTSSSSVAVQCFAILLASTRRQKLRMSFDQAQLAMLALLAEGSSALGDRLEVIMGEVRDDILHHMDNQHSEQMQLLRRLQGHGPAAQYQDFLYAGQLNGKAADSASAASSSFAAAVFSMMGDLELRLFRNPCDIPALLQLIDILTVQVVTEQHQHQHQRLLTQQQQQQNSQQQQQERQMVAAAALDVLLHLTPRPEGVQSRLACSSRDDVCCETGLAAALLKVRGVPAALAACLGTGWVDDVACKAAELLAILVSSQPTLISSSSSSTSPAAVAAGGEWQDLAGGIWSGLLELLDCGNCITVVAAREAIAAIESHPTLASRL